MNIKAKKVKKVKVTLSITQEAQNVIFDHGYASARTIGEFISNLIVDYDKRLSSSPTPLGNADPKSKKQNTLSHN